MKIAASPRDVSSSARRRVRRYRRIRLKPLTQAIALALMVGNAEAGARPFSAQWFDSMRESRAEHTRRPSGRPHQPPPLAQQQHGREVRRSFERMTRTAASIAAQQAAARAAAEAAATNVPNGLGQGALQVDTDALTAGWHNAEAPRQSRDGDRTRVTIKQTDKKAILNWETFNVGQDTTVRFDQSGGNRDGGNDWSALNRVNDPNGRPSDIAGQIEAEGAVYLINRNGIVFHGGSQVNVRNLVASSLSLSDEQFKAGINTPLYFEKTGGGHFGIPQFGAYPDQAGDLYSGLHDEGQPARFEPGEAPGEVIIRKGARIESHDGGKIMAFGPKVENHGTLFSPDGQVILAAGENIWLAESVDPLQVRGLDVAASAPAPWAFGHGQMMGALGIGRVVGAQREFVEGIRDEVMPAMQQRAAEVGYAVTNTGLVSADRGNITMVSREVNQDGALMTSTALDNRNGSIRLQAFGQGMLSHDTSLEGTPVVHWAAGRLTLGEGSLTRVLPDAGDLGEIELSALETRYQTSRVELHGKEVDIRPRADVYVPAGEIDLRAAELPFYLNSVVNSGSDSDYAGDGSRILIGEDAYLSVAGLTDVSVEMARNFVEAELRINELRDSPLQAGSWLYGRTITVDRRDSGLFRSGVMAGVLWNKDENGADAPGLWVGTPLADVSGWVGTGSTDLAELSTIGGRINIQAGGDVITRAGSILDVSGGSVRYEGGWNRSTVLLGADGRRYDIANADPGILYQGIAGEYASEHARWGVTRRWMNPLVRGYRYENAYTEGHAGGAIEIRSGSGMVLEGGYRGGVVLGERQRGLGDAPKGGTLELGGVSLEDRKWSPGRVVVGGNPVRLGDDFDFDSPLGGDFVDVPDPDEPFNFRMRTTYLDSATLEESGLGEIIINMSNDFTLEEGTSMNLTPGSRFYARGNLSKDQAADVRINGAIHIARGEILVTSDGDGEMILGANSVLDTSGQWINEFLQPEDARAVVDGGSVQLINGVSSVMTVEDGAVIDVSGGGLVTVKDGGQRTLTMGDAGRVQLDRVDSDSVARLDMRAYAAGSAGTLDIATHLPVWLQGSQGDEEGIFYLPEHLYAASGFGSIRVFSRSTEGLTVAADADVELRPVHLDMSRIAWSELPTGTDLAGAVPLGVLRPEQRAERAPASLVLEADAPVRVEQGARLAVDIGGRLEVLSTTSGRSGHLEMGGTLVAPGGDIRLAASGGELVLSDSARLLAPGASLVYVETNTGRRVGKVLDGGEVDVSDAGFVTMAEGAVIDVSGTREWIDGAGGRDPVMLASDGGRVNFSGIGLLAGTVRTDAGGATARDGEIHVRVRPAEGTSLLDTLSGVLAFADPGCYGLEGNACDYANWEDALDIDWAPLLGIDSGQPIILPSAFIKTLAAAEGRSGGLVISETASGGETAAETVRPADFGITEETLDVFRDRLLWGSDALRQELAPGQTLAIRPSLLNGAGEVHLAVDSGAIKLGGISLSATSALHLDGTLDRGEGGSATLAAPRVVLSGSYDGSLDNLSDPRASERLLLDAELIDIVGGNYIGGFADTVLQAETIRFSEAKAQLSTPGALRLRADSVYPDSGTEALIYSRQHLALERYRGDSVTVPLSAGGTLRLRAPVIDHNGVLQAPFGQIELVAGASLTLGEQSLTSVSGAGVVVPYGELSNGEHWLDPTLPPGTGDAEHYLAAPPEKRILMDSDQVTLAEGAVIDLSGGGDLHAAEFVPGPGGSHDVLTLPGMYAVLPGYDGPAPEQNTNRPVRRVWLQGGGLEAGWYTLLPARYALLPGAFAVQATDIPWLGGEGKVAPQRDGSLIVAGREGRRYGPGEDEVPSVWRVMSGDVVRQYTEYNEALANTFFSSEQFALTRYRLTGNDIVVPRLPRDGGTVVFDAGQRLRLDGELRSRADTGGRGGLVDISSARIAVVGAGQDRADLTAGGYLILDSDDLSEFGAGSLLLGGIRRGDDQGVRVDVTASEILVRNDEESALRGPEIILAASDTVTLEDGGVIVAEGDAGAAAEDLLVSPQEAAQYRDPDGRLDDNFDGVIDEQDAADDILVAPARDWGALVLVSTGPAVRVRREGVDTRAPGVVDIGANAHLDGGAALLIDATRTTNLAASARLAGEDLSVAAGRIGFGGGGEGLILDQGSLARFAQSRRLTLRSYSSFDFHRSVALDAAGLEWVTLDGAALVGHGDQDISLRADTIALRNTGGGTPVTSGSGTGRLSLDAGVLRLEDGDKSLAGFDTVDIRARDYVLAVGEGDLRAATNTLTLDAPVVTGASGAIQSLGTDGRLRLIASSPMGDDVPMNHLGAQLSLEGRSVDIAGRVMARGGAVSVHSTDGDLVLAEGALVSVAGAARYFFDHAEDAGAGEIRLSALGGDVRLDAGSQLDLSAEGAGDAGTLTVAAADGGSVRLDGDMNARAGGSGRAGAFSLDIDTLADFAGFSERLNQAGFNRSREFRIRQGDVVLDGQTQVESLRVTADAGRVRIAGTVDARSLYGGEVSIHAGNGIAMESGAVLLAGATGDLGSGRVTLDAVGGGLDLRGGVIDVSGGERGKVRLRADRNAANTDLAVEHLDVEVVGARQAVLEGLRRYHSDSVSAVRDLVVTEANAFAANAGAIGQRLGNDDFMVMPGVEIHSDGDLRVGMDWNLHDDFAGARSGSLILRAAGDLIVDGHLSDGFDRADRAGEQLADASWDLNLIAGADLTSADRLALRSSGDNGDLTVGTVDADTGEAQGKMIRTGSGDIAVRAAGDLMLEDAGSAIYTAGRRDTTAWDDFTTARDGASYGIEGGHLSVVAGGGIQAKPSDQSFVDWIKRQGNVNEGFYYGVAPPFLSAPEQPSWWVDYGAFEQGLGTLGGGNLSVRAGGDLNDLRVALTTNMRMRGGRTADERKLMEVRNGGMLSVEAGGAIRGGHYYLARGDGRINAATTTEGRSVAVSYTDGRPQKSYDLAPIVSLGDAQLMVRTSTDLRLQSVVDPLLVRDYRGITESREDFGAYMSGYTDRTSLDLVSVGGDVTLVNQGEFIFRDVTLGHASYPDVELVGIGANRYPAMTRVAALNGDIHLHNVMWLLPARQSDFRLLAAGDITSTNPSRGNNDSSVVMARATPEMMPNPYLPVGGDGYPLQINLDAVLRNQYNGYLSGTHDGYYQELGNPDVLPMIGDDQPSLIYAAEGSIQNLDVFASEALWARAGTDIRTISLYGRNLHATDTTWIDAGNDIVAMSAPNWRNQVIQEGPGTLLLSAGRDIYADRIALITQGNRAYDSNNRPIPDSEVRGLPEQGASVTLMAGLRGEPRYQAFVDAYLNPERVAEMPDYLAVTLDDGTRVPLYWLQRTEVRGGHEKVVQRGLVSYVQEVTGETLAPMAAWERFLGLPELTRNAFVQRIFLLELREAGRDQNVPGFDDQPLNGGYNRGYAAIETLFPGTEWDGDVAANSLTVRTMSGGDINVLTPGGGLQVAALGVTVPDGEGLVTLGSGHINVFAHDNVVVNRSRLLSFVADQSRQGSDQIIWATEGDIDAGRGAKTVRLPSAPEVVTDADANTTMRERPDMSGSGIGTVGDGDVDLIAPKGTVNAGDAGIRVAGNLNVAAYRVVNVDNIEVGGESTGLPPVISVNVGALTAASQAAGSAQRAAEEVTRRTPRQPPSVISVEILGYGQERLEPQPRPSPAPTPPLSYNPNSAIRVIGDGDLSPEQRRELTMEERRHL
ncbi:filamentous hemagglutinin family protein [Alcanivoracaceae bacterium MT1]